MARGKSSNKNSTVPDKEKDILADLFNQSQHVASSDAALNRLKKVYHKMEFAKFEKSFKVCVKKLFQSKQSIYFKTSCDFLCKFLQYISKLSDDMKGRETRVPELPPPPPPPAPGPKRRGTKRKAPEVSEDEQVDELLSDFVSSNASFRDELATGASKRRKSSSSVHSVPIITNHDKIISSCIDVADLYMQVSDEECRLNAVFFIAKFLAFVDTLDETICDALKSTLPKRIRDRKPVVRAHAVLASRKFQDFKMIQEGFLHHFYRDPELLVRKALLQVMDTAAFGYDFLVDSTQDSHEAMRKSAFQRLGKVSPNELSQKQLHRVIHNGLIERDRQASYCFRTSTLDPWLSSLYDGLDLYKLLDPLDVANNHSDVCSLLELIYEKNLEKLQNNGTTTQLHQVVESFRENWLNSDKSCLPQLTKIDEKIITIWLTLVKFCKANQANIKPVKIRQLPSQPENADNSIEKILDSQEVNEDVMELYERLTPDLVNLVGFLNNFVHFSSETLEEKQGDVSKLEFIYQQLMLFTCSYEIGDELERKTVQEVFSIMLKDNLLTGVFQNFIPPIIKSLFNLVYSSSSKLMTNYISEMIHNVRSHLEDLASSAVAPPPKNLIHSAIKAPSKETRSAKKVRIQAQPRSSLVAEEENQNLEFKIATKRVDLEELKDKLDKCIHSRDFDEAKIINDKIKELQGELAELHDRRCSVTSDVSHMSMIIETGASGDGKLCSTMINNTSLDDSNSSIQSKENPKIFKNHSNELLKCLEMYFGCLQCAKISQIPPTMLNQLIYLSYECLDECFKENVKIRSLMIACNGLTALIDRKFAEDPTTLLLLTAACFDQQAIELRTVGFKGLVDVLCQHDNLESPDDKLERFLRMSLREYGKYDPDNMKPKEFEFITTLIEGATKLFYFRRISSPQVLSHIIIWWYHPRTPSKLKQYIGVFLPTFVRDMSLKHGASSDSWLKELFENTFVICIEYLHDYCLNEGYNVMAATDMTSLMNFLCNLIPISFHIGIKEKVEEKIDDLSSSSPDLVKYLKQSKSLLATKEAVNSHNDTVVSARPLGVSQGVNLIHQ